ncbi:hypothetical protein OH799_11850 [Nocardia sp. NBC_00881]|uniref:hypothetical protein n=1 Tax=Nocardia sp. NBC_00881 TaxID=2975995 RepID=UPI00386718E1|nr:hypothetical protein OH799_11850 [Nocardia sp. NBC_00881]
MKAPTRAQVKVLKSLQNRSVIVTSMLAEATRHQQQTGHRPPQSWYENFHDHAILREELTNATHAAGVPRAWIDHVRERGQRGVSWRADLYLRTPDAVDWNQVLSSLDVDVQRLREWTALAAAYGPIGARAEISVAAGFDRNLRVLRSRTAGVANLLGLSVEQGDQLWGTESDWVAAGMAMVDGVPVEGVAQRWRQAARTDTRVYALQATALADAGIAIDTAVALPSHEQLGPPISAALTPLQPLFQSAATPGEEIETAIGAANLTDNADTDAEIAIGAPTFSDAPGTDPWTSYPSPSDVPAAPPIWQGIEL